MCRTTVIILLALILFASSASARIIEVPEDERTIQAAIDASRANDTVLVQPGTYAPINFNGHAVVVGSLILTTEDNAYIDSTIIDGANQGPCVVFNHEEVETSVLRGFTVQNGIQNYGGGIDCQRNTRPRIQDLHITSNIGRTASGGMHCSTNSRPLIENCLFDNNQAVDGMGGGAFGATYGSFPVMNHCELTENTSNNYSGAIWIWQAGLLLQNTDIINNQSSGIAAFFADSVIMRDCNVSGNISGEAWVGTGIYIGYDDEPGDPTYVDFDNVQVTDNESARAGAFTLVDCFGSLNHLTVVNNRTQQSPTVSLAGIDVAITNSIFFENSQRIRIWLGQDGNERPVIDYCDIEGGFEGLEIDGDENLLTYGDNNIDADPLFLDPDEHDYHLTHDSPCIDAGDPDSPRDPDSSRADIGAYFFMQIGGILAGRVFDAETDAPLRDLIIYTDHGFIGITDTLGQFAFPFFTLDSLRIELTFRAGGYITEIIDTMVYEGDSLWFDIGLEHGLFRVTPDSLLADVDSGGFAQLPITIYNDGNGPLSWSATPQNRGEAGLPPFSLRDTILVGQITEDERIEGVAFDGENYYLSGANGDEPNLIYVINREDELVGSFPQPGSPRFGYKDMEWDGEHLWAAGEDSIYALTTEGEVADVWPDPLSPTNNIAFDPVEGVLWLSGTTTDILAFDREGNNLGTRLDRQGLRIYGLGWYENDPDSARLYVVNNPGGGENQGQIHKINTATGEMMVAYVFEAVEGATGHQSSFIVPQFDKYKSPALLTILNRAANVGGDRLDVFQLDANTAWMEVTPGDGEIPAAGEAELQLTLRTIADEGDDWVFDLGEYEGEIAFTSDARNGEVILPVTMTVILPNSSESSALSPFTFHLSQPYPNPFNSSTTICFSTGSQAAPARLAVYDIHGRFVADLTPPFSYSASVEGKVVWSAERLPGGIYLVRLESGKETKTVKVVLMK